ncbi:MAG: heavy metal translocating P-type ATPase [Armatimonadota bacterium]
MAGPDDSSELSCCGSDDGDDRSEALLIGSVAVLVGASWVLRWLAVEPPQLGIACAVAAAAIGVYPLARGALRSLRQKHITVDLLVTIAVVAAVAYGEYQAAGMVAFIMLLGEYLERRASRRSRRAIAALLDVAPEMAVVRREGVEVTVLAGEVQPGEVVVVRPGQRIPVDGRVRAGEAAVNESFITGESLPRDRAYADEVFASTVVEEGALDIIATRVGDDLTVARIRRIVEEAETNRAPVQRVTDRFAAWFVPLILVVGVAVWLLTGSPERGIAVLVVACPCSLVLATPTAIDAGIARAAREGILIRGGAHLEAAGRIDAVALDKTGTVTSGKPVVVEVLSTDGFSERDVLRLAGVADKRSEHPVARTIVAAAAAEFGDVPDPDEFSSSRGFGVTARAGADEIAVGSGRHMADAGIEVSAELTDMAERQRANENAAAFVGVNGKLAGIVFVADALRDQSSDMIGALDEMGIKHIVLLTGDASPVARRVADQVGIREVRAEMLPEDKIAEIETLSGHPHRVAMVGDGVNDAPALAAADLGIAMGVGGADLAIDAADVALMGDDVGKIPTTLGLGRRALGIIKQNIVFSLVLNAAAVAVVAMGWLNIVGAAVVHQISSLAVILNSLRLLSGAKPSS